MFDHSPRLVSKPSSILEAPRIFLHMGSASNSIGKRIPTGKAEFVLIEALSLP
jgi:hypothetical protein